MAEWYIRMENGKIAEKRPITRGRPPKGFLRMDDKGVATLESGNPVAAILVTAAQENLAANPSVPAAPQKFPTLKEIAAQEPEEDDEETEEDDDFFVDEEEESDEDNENDDKVGRTDPDDEEMETANREQDDDEIDWDSMDFDERD